MYLFPQNSTQQLPVNTSTHKTVSHVCGTSMNSIIFLCDFDVKSEFDILTYNTIEWYNTSAHNGYE